MKQILNHLIAFFRQRPARRRQARLHVEALEAREVLSASPLPLSTTTQALAVVAAPHADSTGGPAGIVSPETAVHGYKWRRPHPWDVGTPGAEVTALHPSGQVALSDGSLSQQGEVFLHLAAGGSDGQNVLVGNGVLVVHGQEGPLPTETNASAR